MGQSGSLTSTDTADDDRSADSAWDIVLDAARRADALSEDNRTVAFRMAIDSESGQWVLEEATPGSAEIVLIWEAGGGWTLELRAADPRAVRIDLYLPVCSATRRRPIVVGHLGQSLDGFIATHSGDSQFVTGPENIVHLHRMRALSDAIVVGAGTVAADDPLLTTRHVAGPSPVRVVFDPGRRLGAHYKVFNDDAADTLYVCSRSMVQPGETHFGRATIVPVDDTDEIVDVTDVLGMLRARQCHRIFVEGGGVTVSSFLEAGLLDRLQVAIAPLIIGSGRPAIRLPPPGTLADCARPQHRVFRMGGDIFFDCDLRRPPPSSLDSSALPEVVRIL
jgi:diaminohydroxyphosphoribosylaminopyrimidine deaminase/5-amino-6-(5-phosphoribosylamino)uracil reductase